MKRRKVFAIVLSAVAVIVLTSAAANEDTPQTAYIKKYASVAVSEMYRSGIPASITLAQGLLESGYGLSPLAKEGNNHFGIKCHDWTGKKMYYDDDKRGECFRVYKNADESFKDHSDFIRYRDRYKSLFDNEITDYKSWAYGLKKAGYATDSSYPSKLIRLIETYNLSQYDTMKPEDFGKVSKSEDSQKSSVKSNAKNKRKSRAERRHNKGAASESVQSTTTVATSSVTDSSEDEEISDNEGTEVVADSVAATQKTTKSIPESPLSLEEPKKVVKREASEVFSFSLTRQLYTENGVEFVYSQEGESYSTIASDFHLFLNEILRFNDADEDTFLPVGTMVYIQSKKNQATRGLEKYISDEGGEKLRDLSQRFGIKLKSLCKINGCTPDKVTEPGDMIKLRADAGKR